MNDYKLFLMGCYYAVVKIRPFTNDLYNFCKLMEYVGLKENIELFEKSACDSRAREKKTEKEYIREEDFCEDYFLHLAEINGVKRNEICIEFQFDKGFTFGKEEDYVNGDEVKILSVNDLIIATGYKSEFMLDGEDIILQDIDKRYRELDYFCEFYEWQVQKFGKRYNILDTQTEEFKFDESVNLDDIIERIYFRMLDYFFDEEITDNLDFSDDEDLRYAETKGENYLKLGKELGLLEEETYNYYNKRFKEEVECE